MQRLNLDQSDIVTEFQFFHFSDKTLIMKESEVKVGATATDLPASLENGVVDENTTRFGHGEVDVIKIQEGNAVLRKLREAELWLDRKLKIEGMGAERIPDSERRPPHVLNVSTPWRLGLC